MKRFILTFVVVLATVFNAKADGLTSVEIAGEFNGWGRTEFKNVGNGLWTLNLDKFFGSFKLVYNVTDWKSNGRTLSVDDSYLFDGSNWDDISSVDEEHAYTNVLLVFNENVADGKQSLTLYDFYIAGSFNGWSNGDAPKMNYNPETEKFEYVFASNNPLQNEYQPHSAGFKILSDKDWSKSYGAYENITINSPLNIYRGGNDITFTIPAISNAKISLDPITKELTLQGHEAVNFGDDPYATFSSQHNTVVPAGVTAYRASSSNATSVRLTPIEGNVLPANTGVILEKTGETGAYDFDYTSEAASEVENLLAPSTGVTAEAGDFILSDNPWAFYPLSAGGALKANRAYLPKANLPTTTANAPVRIVFDETTDINGVQNTECGKQNGAYNLAGQKVSMDYKGIVIVNGKKFINK